MDPFNHLKIVSQLLDVPIVDKDERSCGIVDDVDLSGSAGKEMRVAALLVGPGAYAGRMPKWMYWLVRKIAGDRIARVPADQVAEIGSVVKLKLRGEELGLHGAEDKAAAWIPRWGAI
jgi:sporulation protein YlmC with PRC-barrel domain